MNLNIMYSSNDTGETLLSRARKEWQEVEFQEVDVQGISYFKIEIIDPLSKVTNTLNTIQGIMNCINHERISEILKINGIACGNLNEESIIKSYDVLICDQSIVSIKMVSSRSNSAKYIRENENSKVVEMAKRSVHLVGLDFGLVTVVYTAKRRYKVLMIEPSPVVRAKDFSAMFKKIKNIFDVEENMAGKEIKLGADPEFMMINKKSGRIVSASDFFPRDGSVGCDNIRMPNRQARPVAELRPRPSYSPIELSETIRECLVNANHLAPYKNVKWLGGSQPVSGYSIGGHIHFSGVKINAWILRALDNYIGLIVSLIEEPSTAAKRRKKYGYLGDYRNKEHGGFEYRTPGSWLVSQEITTAVLCLAKIVASRYYYLSENHLASPEAQRAFYEGNHEFFQEIFSEKIWANLGKLDLYAHYSEQLAPIRQMIINGEIWNEKEDFRKDWKGIKPSGKTAPKPRLASPSSSSSDISRAGGTISASASVTRARNIRPRAVSPVGQGSSYSPSLPSGRIIGTSNFSTSSGSPGIITQSSQIRRGTRITR